MFHDHCSEIVDGLLDARGDQVVLEEMHLASDE